MKKALSLLTVSALSIGMLSACGPKDSGKKEEKSKTMIFLFGKMIKRCWFRTSSESFEEKYKVKVKVVEMQMTDQ